MKRLAAAIALASTCLAVPAGAFPPQYDPALRFRTVETPHFRIHFHEGGEALAQRTAVLAERAHRLLSPLLGHAGSEPTQVLLVDSDDSANGWALATPYNTMELLAAPPDQRSVLNTFDDWLWLLVAHEYTHVLHIDTVRGPAHVANRLFGKMLSPNGAWPRWFIEGLAVWAESFLSTGGRLRSSLHDMELRMHVLSGRAFDLGLLTNTPLTWPRGDAWYLYGGRFLDFLARRHGPAALRGISLENATTVVPWLLEEIARDQTGTTFSEAYALFLDEQHERYEAQRASVEPATPERFLTAHGEGWRTPRLSPDGRMLYALRVVDPDRRPTVRAIELASGTERILAEVNGDGSLAVLPDGRLLLGQPDVHRTFNFFDDLYVLDPRTGAFERQTHGARLSDPDVDANGRVVCVHRPGQARTALVLADSLADLRGGRFRVLHEPPPGELVGSPRFSPDGRSIAFVEHRDGSFDIRVLDLATGALTDVTHDAAQDLAPAWRPDGDAIVFSSDRTGIYDVYEVELASGTEWRLTRVLGGAFDPLPTPDRLYYVGYRAFGYDLASRDAPFREPAPGSYPRPPAPPGLEDPPGTPTSYPVRDYDPFPTLRPAYWLPAIGADARGPTLGFTTLGSDVTGRWHWNAAAWLGLGSNEPGYAASLRTDALWPALTLSSSRTLDRVSGAPSDYTETRLGVRLGGTFLWRSRWNVLRADLAWQVSHLAPASGSADSPENPRTGRLSQGTLSLGYSNARRFVRSISTAEGRRLSLDLRAAMPWTGSEIELWSATASWAEFLPIPFLPHHVLGLRVLGGFGGGDDHRRRAFGIGGPSVWSIGPDLLTLQSPTDLLRGFPPNVASGRAVVLGTLEWRFPIATFERGFGVLPFFVRRLHGAAFVDAGDAFESIDRATLRIGAGVELRAELTFAYSLTGDLRLGYARGLTAGGTDQLLLLAGTHF